MLEIGSDAPDFKLKSSDGGSLNSKELRGKYSVIVFYPKNNTPG